jgi:pimeloyl-ACP methyl ester carboxylesterase
VSCPSLVLRPDDDRVVPTVQAARYADILPHARLGVVTSDSGALGHAMIAQDPKAVARAITTFYDGLHENGSDA